MRKRTSETFLSAVANNETDNRFVVNMQWLRQLKLHNITYWQAVSTSHHFRVIAIFGFAPSSAMPQLPLLQLAYEKVDIHVRYYTWTKTFMKKDRLGKRVPTYDNFGISQSQRGLCRRVAHSSCALHWQGSGLFFIEVGAHLRRASDAVWTNEAKVGRRVGRFRCCEPGFACAVHVADPWTSH